MPASAIAKKIDRSHKIYFQFWEKEYEEKLAFL